MPHCFFAITTPAAGEAPRLPAQCRGVVRAVLLLVAGVAAVGCAPSPRRALSGKVTLDGAPLPSGYITFRPLHETAGPTAGAEILAGEYRIPAHQGTFEGRFEVQIVATRPTTRRIRDPLDGSPGFAVEQYLPPRYNQQSELVIEIEARETYDFDLKSRAVD